jgi:hypothetical protein
MLIDLRKIREPLADDIRKSLAAFSAQHLDTPVCTVGVFGDGFHGAASLYLDTPDHSSAFVKEWRDQGPAWYGRDSEGTFCNSCCDFPHCIGEYEFLGYPDFYEADIDAPIDYITIDGVRERVEAEEGDEGKNRIVFPFLKIVVAEFEPFRQLSRVAPFRVGVQMHDSAYKEFWTVGT